MINSFSARDRLNSASKAILPKPLVSKFTYQDNSKNPTNCKNKKELIHKFKKYLYKNNYKIKSHTKQKWSVYDHNSSDFSCYEHGCSIPVKGPITIFFIGKGCGYVHNLMAFGVMEDFYNQKISNKLINRMFSLDFGNLFCFHNIYNLPNAFKNATLLGSKVIKWANELSDYPFA